MCLAFSLLHYTTIKTKKYEKKRDSITFEIEFELNLSIVCKYLEKSNLLLPNVIQTDYRILFQENDKRFEYSMSKKC